MDNTREVSNHTPKPKSSFDPQAEIRRLIPADQRAQVDAVLAGEQEYLLATGVDARRMSADLEELRRLRLKTAGGYVFKRGRSRYWQI